MAAGSEVPFVLIKPRASKQATLNDSLGEERQTPMTSSKLNLNLLIKTVGWFLPQAKENSSPNSFSRSSQGLKGLSFEYRLLEAPLSNSINTPSKQNCCPTLDNFLQDSSEAFKSVVE